MSDQRPPVYIEEGCPVYRASSLGLPVRSLVAARLGHKPTPPPSALQAAAAAGQRLEPTVKARLDMAVQCDQQEVRISLPSAIVRGHIDGMVDGDLLEVKTVKDEQALVAWLAGGWGVRPGWAWQVSAYGHAMATSNVQMAVMARDTERLEVTSHPLPFSLSHIHERIAMVEDWAHRGELPLPEPGYSGWDPWAYLHRPEAVQDDELADLLQEYDQLKSVDSARLAELREALEFLLAGRGRVCAGGFEASLTAINSTRFDQKRFERDHPELFQSYCRESSSTRLAVRKLKENHNA